METDGKKLLLHAPAKINLFLHVLGRRSDGYHDLETWMQKLDLSDRVFLEKCEGTGIDFSCDDPLLSGETNLAVRAAKSFFTVLGKTVLPKVRIHLEKKIPVAAGLGGGSSDAGTVLRGLNLLFGQPFSETELIKIARPLGSDVPFFTVEHTAVIAHGTGDIMSPVDPLRDCTFILVNPGFFVSTRWVFENFSLTRMEKKYTFPRFRNCKAESLSLSLMHNDLEAVTGAEYTEIGDMKQRLSKLGASKVLMSGSGATVYGIFPDREKANEPDFRSVVRDLRQRFGEKVFVARTHAGAWPSG